MCQTVANWLWTKLSSSQFFIQFWPGFLAELLASAAFFLVIDWRIRRRDEKIHDQEIESERVHRTKAKNAIIQAALLQQFPPIIQRMLDIQQAAFSDALFQYDTSCNSTLLQMRSITNMKHYANAQLDTSESLKYLNVKVVKIHHHAHLTNAIAVLAIKKVRDKIDINPILPQYTRLLDRIQKTVPKLAYCRPHLDRLNHLLGIAIPKLVNFEKLSDVEKLQTLSHISEAIGSNTNLLVEQINKSFKCVVDQIDSTCLDSEHA